jgi:hypothetical protein
MSEDRISDTLFDKFWRHHPALQTPPVIEPCSTNGRANHANQCVIRLGVCMALSGIDLAPYQGAFCWNKHGRAHPLRVEQMKLWLNSGHAGFVSSAQIAKRNKRGQQNSHQAYSGRRGIVACLNF